MNLCRSCNKDFGSLSAFDAHWVGKHEYRWSPEHEDGRRCLDEEELTELGWHRDSHGRFRQPISDEARITLASLR
jgi:hypothetical protein